MDDTIGVVFPIYAGRAPKIVIEFLRRVTFNTEYLYFIGTYGNSDSAIGKTLPDECREKAMEADGFIFGTPVHYAAAAGNMTAFMDRLFYSDFCGNGGKSFMFKPAATVVSARRAGTTATFDQINKYYSISQMPVMPSRYWNMVHGTNAEEVKQDLEGMQSMRFLARNMAYYLKCIEAGKKAGINPPEHETVTFTNFIR